MPHGCCVAMAVGLFYLVADYTGNFTIFNQN
jgi:hypothetical protein